MLDLRTTSLKSLKNSWNGFIKTNFIHLYTFFKLETTSKVIYLKYHCFFLTNKTSFVWIALFLLISSYINLIDIERPRFKAMLSARKRFDKHGFFINEIELHLYGVVRS